MASAYIEIYKCYILITASAYEWYKPISKECLRQTKRFDANVVRYHEKENLTSR